MAAAKALQAVEAAIKQASYQDIVSDSLGPSSALDAAGCSAKLDSAMLRVRELLLCDGIALAQLTKKEMDVFIRDARTAADGSFAADEYKALLETLTKYAALKARHTRGKRWSLGLGLSAAGAMALTAAVFTSAGLLLVAAPAGAAIGAVAVAADGSRTRRRDRRTARHSSAALDTSNAPADTPAADTDNLTAAAAAEAPEGPIAEEDTPAEAASPAEASAEASCPVSVSVPAVPSLAAPAPASAVLSSGDSSPRGSSSDELISAVVEVMTPAAAAEADDTAKAVSELSKSADAAVPTIDPAAPVEDRDVPAPVLCDSPFSAASRDTGASYSDLPPAPAAVRISSSTGSASLPLFVPNQSFEGAALPPKPLKKSKSLKKTMKSLKKAFSIKDNDTTAKDAVKATDVDADSDSPLAPPVPPVRRSSKSFFRRSSSDIGDDSLVVEGVERSKGSATIKKMVEGIRRSFSLDRTSLDLVQPKKARKEAVY